MRHWLTIGLLTLMACSSEEELAAPDNLIPQSEFVLLVADINILEAVGAQTNRLEQSSTEDIYGMYRSVFDQHGISQQQFEESFEYYQSQPQLMHDIYEHAYNELLRRQDELKYQQPMPVPADSVETEQHPERPDSLGGTPPQ